MTDSYQKILTDAARVLARAKQAEIDAELLLAEVDRELDRRQHAEPGGKDALLDVRAWVADHEHDRSRDLEVLMLRLLGTEVTHLRALLREAVLNGAGAHMPDGWTQAAKIMLAGTDGG